MAKNKGITPEEKGVIKARIAALLGGTWDASQLVQLRTEVDELVQKIEKRGGMPKPEKADADTQSGSGRKQGPRRL